MLTHAVKTAFLDSCTRLTWGQLTLETPEGESHHFGQSGLHASLRIDDWSMVSRTAARGDIGFGEAYVAGQWDTDNLENLLIVALRNMEVLTKYTYPGFWNRLKFLAVNRILRANSRKGASRNIRAHYDVGNEFYQLWLDESMTYSSALFESDQADLKQAQFAKYDRILNRMSDAPILEVGCGWGGFAERAADDGRHVKGITISPSQKGYADARLDGRADIDLCDYREVSGTYQNIVSIEMIEAVGARYWPTYFNMLKSRMAEGGRSLLQIITVPDSYWPTYIRNSDYIRHYTFPGGMLMCNSEIAKQSENAGLTVADSFEFGSSYARTCRNWADTIKRRRTKIHELGYNDAFVRNWLYYLEGCAAAFTTGQAGVVQVELQHA